MARRKTLPESVRAKLALAERLASLRLELFGERGGPEMARRLGIPVRTWYNYEGGVTVPAEVVLKIIELTAVEAVWLLHGKGPKFRQSALHDRRDASSPAKPAATVEALLRTALQLLENDGTNGSADEMMLGASDPTSPHEESSASIHSDPAADSSEPRGPASHARQKWLEAQRENRSIQVSGDDMAPIIAEGAAVAYSKIDEHPELLDGKLVVVWIDQQPTVRWFQHCGRYALLRAENPAASPQQILIDLESSEELPRIRRVLWIDTPH